MRQRQEGLYFLGILLQLGCKLLGLSDASGLLQEELLRLQRVLANIAFELLHPFLQRRDVDNREQCLGGLRDGGKQGDAGNATE